MRLLTEMGRGKRNGRGGDKLRERSHWKKENGFQTVAPTRQIEKVALRKKNFHIIERINMEMKREMKNARRLACDAIEAANEMSRREGNNIDAKARCI